MSSIPQNYCDENELIDCVQRFFSRHHVGRLLAKLSIPGDSGSSAYFGIYTLGRYISFASNN